MTTHNILIVDDDVDLCDLLKEYLEATGMAIHCIHDGTEAAEHLKHHQYDAVILDFMLPGMQGLDVLQNMRGYSSVPVIMLTARGDDIDRIVGLESGADDYLPKPCNPRELLARLRAILRRSGGENESNDKSVFNMRGICLDPGARTATLHGGSLELTSAEFSTLHVLIMNAGEVVSKEVLTERALNRKLTIYDRSVDVHISNLRKKLSELDNQQEFIKTVRGSGYIFLKQS
ncbi:response regulator transcription factor [bacterium]|nr:response regulator transcription factor [bacterium]